MIVAAIGILINGFTAFLFMKDQQHDLNVKGAFLHMAAYSILMPFGKVRQNQIASRAKTATAFVVGTKSRV